MRGKRTAERASSGRPCLDDTELAAARWLLGQCLEVRLASARALRDAQLVEDRAAAQLEEDLAGMEPAAWEALTDSVRRFKSDSRRRDLAAGRVLFPVTVWRLDPFTVGGEG